MRNDQPSRVPISIRLNAAVRAELEQVAPGYLGGQAASRIP
jgi:hypothetical protein